MGDNYKPDKHHRRSIRLKNYALKTFSSRRINDIGNTPGVPVWLHNYYEHIIRHEDELSRIRQYISENPTRWAEDEDKPINVEKNDKVAYYCRRISPAL